MPNMTKTKANAKENLGQFICLSITKAKAKSNLQIFICNRFRVDGTVLRSKWAVFLNSLMSDSVKRHLSRRHLSVLNFKSNFIVDGGCTREE